MKVTLLRHAESVFNADPENRERDCGLSGRGRAQAAGLRAGGTDGAPNGTNVDLFDWIICSPLRRARDTYALSGLSARPKRHVLIWDCLREWRQDPCDFMEGEDVQCIETEHQALQRVDTLRGALRSLAEPRDRVLLVGHGDFFWLCTSVVKDGERFGTWLPNTGTTVWEL